MFYPKVKFSNISPEIEQRWIFGFLFYNKWGWEKRILKHHPELKNLFAMKKEKDRKIALKKYIRDFKIKNKEEIKQRVDIFKKEWRNIEKLYLSVLSQIIETDWPENRKNIKALISINPICPRFLDDWSFSLFYDLDTKNLLETIMHEICHFLYFKKWKEVFPDAQRKTFDYPYIEWHLSEILAPIILKDERIQKFLKKKPFFYDEHKDLKIDGIKIPEYFLNLYKEHLKIKTSFSDFLKVSHSVIRKNSGLFKF